MVSKKRVAEKKIKQKTLKEGSETNKAIINNFIALQKVMVNLAVKIDSLSNQISKLLELFEISAKSLAKRDIEHEQKNIDSQKIMEKLNGLSQQAGLIGKGLALIHDMNQEKREETRGYQKSIANPSSDFEETIHTGFKPPQKNLFQKERKFNSI